MLPSPAPAGLVCVTCLSADRSVAGFILSYRIMIILPIGDINPRTRVPFVNYTLLALNIGIFFILYFGQDYERVVRQFGLVPLHPQPITFITSLFLHGGILHLLGNMLFLWICGDNVEDRLGHFGFLLLYLASGIIAHLTHIKMTTSPEIPCIGASGAISGVLGAYVVLFPTSKIKFWYFFWLLFIPRAGTFTLASVWALGFWFIEQLLLGYLTSSYQSVGVAYWAHIGGFVFGLMIVGILRFTGLVRGGIKRQS